MSEQQAFDFKPSKPKEPRAFSVSDLNQAIKSNLETEFHTVWLKGEISNFKAHSSGHFYFSLKDSQSQISAVMFRGMNSRLNFRPKDGMEVLVRGKVTVYTPRGGYQVLCEKMDPVGQGGLKEEFEKLKLKLKNEGLFDVRLKKPIPYLPFKIALVTSPTSAAVQDMLQVLRRRHPAAEVIVVPTLTQGDKAAANIIKALGEAESLPGIEVIIVSRGGGSLEDMWCFNDEGLARKIFSMKTPVISGVGHEIDFTIADFVSDLRAPTPSAAAELVCKNVEEIKEKIYQAQGRLKSKVVNLIMNKRSNLNHISKRLIDPRRKLSDLRIKLDELVMRAQRSLDSKINLARQSNKALGLRLLSVQKVFAPKRQKLSFLSERLVSREKSVLSQKAATSSALLGRLEALSPYGVLDRGYSIVRDQKTGKILKDINKIKENSKINVQFSKGKVVAEVLEKSGG